MAEYPERPAWIERVIAVVLNTWVGMDPVSWLVYPDCAFDLLTDEPRYSPDDRWTIEVAPAVAEFVGGPNDGAEVHGFFSIELYPYLVMFDDLPELHWEQERGELTMSGEIDGDDATIILRDRAFEGEEPLAHLLPNGGMVLLDQADDDDDLDDDLDENPS